MLTSPAEFVAYWRSFRERTRRLVLLIPEHDIEWTYAERRWTFGDLVRYLAGIERGMYAETVTGRPSRYPGHDRSLAEGKVAVLRYLDGASPSARSGSGQPLYQQGERDAEGDVERRDEQAQDHDAQR